MDDLDQSLTGDLTENSMANLTNSSVEDTSVISEQEQLYGKIMPTPSKMHEPAHLPPLDSMLVVKKKRGASSSGGIPSGTSSSSSNSSYGGTKKSSSGSNEEESTSVNKVLITPTRPPPLRILKRASTPGKKRNFSSPVLGRIPSLGDTPIPDLSPTGDSLLGNNSDQENVEHEGISSTPNINYRKVSSPSTVRSFTTPLRVSSWSHPAASHVVRPVPMKSLLDEGQNEELKELDLEIKKYERELDNLKKVKRYRDTREDDKLDELVSKWRKAAQMASNYLFNEATIKIDRMGGIAEYRKRQVESQLRKLKNNFDESVLYKVEEFIESPDFKDLSPSERKEILDRRDEMYELSVKVENGEGLIHDSEDEEDLSFTMKELFKQLNQNYELVFPKGVVS